MTKLWLDTETAEALAELLGERGLQVGRVTSVPDPLRGIPGFDGDVQLVKITALPDMGSKFYHAEHYEYYATTDEVVLLDNDIRVWVLGDPDDVVTVGKFYLARASGLRTDGGTQRFVFLVDHSSITSFWAKITDKTYAAGDFTKYDWHEVVDSTAPHPINWPNGPRSGTASSTPAYEANNVDLPVPSIVRLIKGAGDYYLIIDPPRWEFVEKTGAVSGGYFPGKLLRYDQVSKTLVEVQDIAIVDFNA